MDNTVRKKPERGDRPQHVGKTLLRLYGYLAKEQLVFTELLVLMVLIIVCELVHPLIIESCINSIRFSDGLIVNFQGLTVNLILFLFVIGCNALLGYFQGKASAKLSLRMTQRLRQDLFDHLLCLPVADFDRQKRGDLMSRVLSDTDLAAKTFSEALLSVLSSFIVIAGCAVIMLLKNPLLALIAIGAALVTVVLAALLSGFVYPAFLAQQASMGRLDSRIEENIKGFRSSIVSHRIDESIRQMDEASEDFYRKRMRAYLLESIMEPFMLWAGNLSFILLVFFGARLTLTGVITLGTMQAFILYSKQFLEPINSVGEHIISVQNSLAGAERIFSILDTAPEADSPDAKPMPQGIPLLEFRNVRFSYHRNLPLLQDLNLTVHKGETLALVGKTGVGKTTVIHLLLQFYRNYTGDVLLSGVDAKKISLPSLRSSVAYIAQDPQLMSGTVFENIAYGVENATEDDVRTAAQAVGIDALIDSLPNGLYTEIENGFERFSQGQQQLLCLARAVLKKSEIIVIDEATSSVDMTTERLLKDGFTRAVSGKTRIIIAHRLSSVVDADHIAVLDGGRIVQYGTHQTLMASGGLYYTLYKNQLLGKEL